MRPRGRSGAFLAAAFVAVFGAFPFFEGRAAWGALASIAIALTAASARSRARAAFHLGVLSSLLLTTLTAFGSTELWPLPPILATAAYLFITKKAHALTPFPHWLARGRLDGPVWLLIGASLVVSSTALIAWFAVTSPDYSELLALFPKLPVPVLFGGVVVFALLNAALEETIYRGVLMGALDELLGKTLLPVVLQALLFGALHVHGFPRGLVGVGLATIYGLMMGMVRRRAGGMLAPWIAHVGTDVAIGTILLTAAD